MDAIVLIVPTLNAGELWRDWISAVLSQKAYIDSILVIDSESSDETVALANDAGFKTCRVRKDAFDHGGTRRLASEMCSKYEFVIFLTQDAALADTESLKHILSYFDDANVAAVCGRQLPGMDAGPIEAHARLFNYPDVFMSKTLFLDDYDRYVRGIENRVHELIIDRNFARAYIVFGLYKCYIHTVVLAFHYAHHHSFTHGRFQKD